MEAGAIALYESRRGYYSDCDVSGGMDEARATARTVLLAVADQATPDSSKGLEWLRSEEAREVMADLIRTKAANWGMAFEALHENARARYGLDDRPEFFAYFAQQALLAALPSQTCETCAGSKRVTVMDPDYECEEPGQGPCPDCHPGQGKKTAAGFPSDDAKESNLSDRDQLMRAREGQVWRPCISDDRKAAL